MGKGRILLIAAAGTCLLGCSATSNDNPAQRSIANALIKVVVSKGDLPDRILVTVTNTSGKPLAMPGLYPAMTLQLKSESDHVKFFAARPLVPDPQFGIKLIKPGESRTGTLSLKSYVDPYMSIPGRYSCRVLFTDELVNHSPNHGPVASTCGSAESNAIDVTVGKELGTVTGIH